MPQQPIESVQVPQTVGLSPEVAFNIVGQAGLAPMFQAQQVAGRPLPGIATQWGQAPASFAGQAPLPGQAPTQVIAQSPVAGSWSGPRQAPRSRRRSRRWAGSSPR